MSESCSRGFKILYDKRFAMNSLLIHVLKKIIRRCNEAFEKIKCYYRERVQAQLFVFHTLAIASITIESRLDLLPYLRPLVHPVSIKTHCATRSCHASLSKVKCSICVFPGHSDALQILAYDIVPVLSRPSWSSACCTHFPGYGLFRNPVIIHSQHVSKPSQPCLLYTSPSPRDQA